ncbi:hypothetical protein ACFC09_32935 [Streptomyces sp. NPDC056161]|uniref:DUF6895 family protein n=1 Tax=Streptomyces sp. NPDC056161 TaxID=3345732 RepID=UPI0035E23B51
MTTQAAPPAHLHAVGGRALGWLFEHREHFRLTEEDRATTSGLVERLKPISELAIITHVLFREGVAGARQREQAGALLDFAWRDLLDGGNELARLQQDEPLSTIPLETYAVFHGHGYRHPRLQAGVTLSRRLRNWTAQEHLPNRRLGILNWERRLGLAPSGNVGQAVSRTWLGQLPEPWTLQYATAYDLTHTVFHLTDWGEAPDRIPPRIADYLTLYLPAWLDEWADLQHWDLLGELLVVDACLPYPALDRRIWERYAAAQAPDGAMPAHRTLPQGDTDHVFDQVHHPTLVAAFASAMATSRALTTSPA